MPLPKSFPLFSKGSPIRKSKNTICNRYAIKNTIGTGSYGSVYEVMDLKTKTVRALKRLRLSGDSGEEESELIDAALAEANILSSLKHPNIVTLLDAFKENNYFYIVMELCSEGTLDSFMNKVQDGEATMTSEITVRWTYQLAHALQYIHERKIIHRDMKSKNIFLAKNSKSDGLLNVKLGDFGICRTLSGTTDQASTCIGTPYYFSPELFKRAGYNTKTDMWALGCLLYEMCCLQHPFMPADNLPQLMHKVTTKDPDFDQWLGPSSLLDLGKKLLSKKPRSRLDAKQVIEFLDREFGDMVQKIDIVE